MCPIREASLASASYLRRNAVPGFILYLIRSAPFADSLSIVLAFIGLYGNFNRIFV